MTLERATVIADKILMTGPHYGFRTNNTLQEFIATIAHESGGFRIKEENMRYVTRESIRNTWPSRFTLSSAPGKKDPAPFVKQPEKLANEVYMRKELGNVNPGDGWAFRGSGFIQGTGRYFAEAYGKYVGITDSIEVMNLCRTDDYWAIDAAMWEFAVDKKLLDEADANQFVLVTKRINGALIGWTSRDEFYQRCLRFLPS